MIHCPENQRVFRTLQSFPHTYDKPDANSSVPSVRPVRLPGAADLLKLLLLTAFPKPPVPSLASQLSRVQSM